MARPARVIIFNIRFSSFHSITHANLLLFFLYSQSSYHIKIYISSSLAAYPLPPRTLSVMINEIFSLVDRIHNVSGVISQSVNH